ncbi:MAG: MGMT family protein [SAR86 cluster bacterium]|nr:MGMT family protein [SAR86 cluster bacterium]
MATEFQKSVWAEIDKIPYGKTVTYKQIAENIGKPNASRAVANACGQNPTPIIRPCHRVICSNGDIGGYSAPGGAIAKKELLKKENP